MTEVLRGQTIVDILIDDLYLLWQIKNLFSNPPSYEKYNELDIAYRKMMSFNNPSNENWKLLIQLLTGMSHQNGWSKIRDIFGQI
jgi:hypothetical protein